MARTNPKPPKRRRPPTYALDVERLEHVDLSTVSYQGQSSRSVLAWADRDRGWVVQVYNDCIGCKGTPWEGTLRVSIKHTKARTPKEYEKRYTGVAITWDELQAIKDHFWPNRVALEVYPPHDRIVDVAEMRWLWVLPPVAFIPFNLQSGEKRLDSR